MRGKSNRDGYTLVEIMVSGGLILLLALMMAQGFAVCNHLVLRDRQFRKADERLEEQMVREGRPAARERVALEVGDYGTWEVEIDTYKMKSGEIETSFRILRKSE